MHQPACSQSHDDIVYIIDEWFRGRGVTDLDVDMSYMEQNAIDSLGLIELIEDMEHEFKIRFSAADFQDRRFVTISGLGFIIHERLQS